MEMMYTMIQASGEVDKALKAVENFQSLGNFVPATMSGIAAIFAMMQKPYAQHMNNGMQYHPANELTSIAVHIREYVGDAIDDNHIQQHLSPQRDWVDDKWLYSHNMEL
jgi:hypothetical protein